MPASTHPNLPLAYKWALGDPYKTEMDANLVMLGAIVGLSVISRTLDTPPASPANGHRYIVGSAPTGAWAGQAGKIALWIDAAWVFFQPKTGWLAYIEDEAKLAAYTPTGWSAGIAI
ncbi:MAG: DUF2793 domain-containing protein [Pseudomonadota bacterium]